jgi:subtilase family serine protease
MSVAATGAANAAPSGRSAIPSALVHLRPGIVKPAIARSTKALSLAQCEAMYKIACYGPGQLQQAYGLKKLYSKGIDGRGQTIVIVDPFGSPTIQNDLKVFDSTYKLPAPPSLKVIQPAGKVAPYDPTNGDMVGWAGETTLDVEYAHSMAPKAHILLVETPVSEDEGTSGFPQIVKAETYVIDHHLGGVISQSFSATEETFPSKQSLLNLRGAYIDAAKKHVTVLTASGDDGASDATSGPDNYTKPVTSWPDSDPLVTGIGGTQLHLNAKGDRVKADTAWNDTYSVATNQFIFGDNGPNPISSGGGKSIIFNRPGYQNGVRNVVGKQRGVPDISMSGACNGAVNAYQSFGGQTPGWYQVCGTSEATPLFSGIVALADQVAHHPIGLINPALYALSALRAAGIDDVTSGNNTVSFTQGGKLVTVKGFPARKGYDLVTGVGTINGAWFVPELARLAH